MRLSVLVVLCTIATALDALRPGAQWAVRGSDIEWLDKVQAQPTLSEINQSISNCQASILTTQTKVTTDKAVMANAISTTDQKLNALIDLLNTTNAIPTATAVQVGP